MNRFFGMMRYSKQALIVFIFALIELIFTLGVIIFDVIQFVIVKNNSAKLSSVFVTLNISLIVVVGLNLLMVVTMFIAKIVKEKKNGFKKG